MYDLFYNFFIQNNVLGSATSFESTLIIARYISIVCCFLVIYSLFYCVFKLIKITFNR